MRLVVLILLTLSGESHARGPWRASESNTSGWTFMTPKERLEHQAQIRAFKRYDECHAYQLDHHAAMISRAKKHGKVLPADHHDACKHLRNSDASQPVR